jgi:retinol dehydrogenase-12
MHLGVNHLSHYLLTRLLLNKLEASAPSRIVNVSSVAYEKGRIDWDDLMLDKNFDFRKAYRQSKLANVLFTRELAKRLQGTGVNVYCLHPGVVLTEISRDIEQKHKMIYTILFYFLYPLLWLFLKKPVNGAQTTIFCAVDESISTKSGRYFCDCKEKTLLPHGLDNASATKLWTLSETLIKSYLE